MTEAVSRNLIRLMPNYRLDSNDGLLKLFRAHAQEPETCLVLIATILRAKLSIDISDWTTPVQEWGLPVPSAFANNPPIGPGWLVSWARAGDESLWLRVAADGRVICMIDANRPYFTNYMRKAVNVVKSYSVLLAACVDLECTLYMLKTHNQINTILGLYLAL